MRRYEHEEMKNERNKSQFYKHWCLPNPKVNLLLFMYASTRTQRISTSIQVILAKQFLQSFLEGSQASTPTSMF